MAPDETARAYADDRMTRQTTIAAQQDVDGLRGTTHVTGTPLLPVDDAMAVNRQAATRLSAGDAALRTMGRPHAVDARELRPPAIDVKPDLYDSNFASIIVQSITELGGGW